MNLEPPTIFLGGHELPVVNLLDHGRTSDCWCQPTREFHWTGKRWEFVWKHWPTKIGDRCVNEPDCTSAVSQIADADRTVMTACQWFANTCRGFTEWAWLNADDGAFDNDTEPSTSTDG